MEISTDSTTPNQQPTNEQPRLSDTLRKAGIVLGLLIIIGGYFGSAVLREMKKPPKQIPTFSGNKTARVIKVSNSTQQLVIPVTGRFITSERFAVVSEVGGRLLDRKFRLTEGASFKKGDTLLVIDDREARLALAAQRGTFIRALSAAMPEITLDFPERKSTWERYINSVSAESTLPSLPEITNAKEKYFLSSRDIISQYYSIKRQEVALEKYAFIAPFTGSVASSEIKPGAIVRANQPLGEITGVTSLEYETSASAEEAAFLRTGNPVVLQAEGNTWRGSIKRISALIDPTTQTVKMYVGVQGNGLRDGLYAEGSIYAESVNDAYLLPRKLLRDDGKVFIVQDSILRLLPVKSILRNNTTVIVQGIPNNALLLAEPIPGAREGLKVSPIAEKEKA